MLRAWSRPAARLLSYYLRYLTKLAKVPYERAYLINVIITCYNLPVVLNQK